MHDRRTHAGYSIQRGLSILVMVPHERFDPLLQHVELPLEATFYPAGFPLHIATNSQHVVEAAAESWSCCAAEFKAEPLRFRVVIEPEGELAGPPAFRMHDQILSVVSDAHNFATADIRRLLVHFHLSEKTAADHAWLRWFYVEALAYMLLAQTHLVPIHAACVARTGSGLLLCGASGSGKSTLAFACARAGWTYVCDDCTWLLPGSSDRMAIGSPHQVRFRHDAPRHFPELAGYVARTRPNGKLSIEVPTSLFPDIPTAVRCPIGGMVFLDRESGGTARTEPMDTADAVAALLRDMPSYGDEVNAIHEQTLGALLVLPAWRIYYRSLEEALGLLAEIQPGVTLARR